MFPYAQLFVNHMNANGIKYTEENERVIKVAYGGDNMDSIAVYVFFDKDGEPMIQCKSWNILNFKNNVDKGIVVCNQLNAKYRWVKFYIDDDSDVICELDAMIDEETCGNECLTLVRRIVSIVDEAYPVLAKARWA